MLRKLKTLAWWKKEKFYSTENQVLEGGGRSVGQTGKKKRSHVFLWRAPKRGSGARERRRVSGGRREGWGRGVFTASGACHLQGDGLLLCDLVQVTNTQAGAMKLRMAVGIRTRTNKTKPGHRKSTLTCDIVTLFLWRW